MKPPPGPSSGRTDLAEHEADLVDVDKEECTGVGGIRLIFISFVVFCTIMGEIGEE